MKKFTIEYIKEFCKQIGTECLSDKYIGIKENLDLVCPKCGEIYKRNFDNIKTRRSPLCSDCGLDIIKNKMLTPLDEIIKMVRSEGYDFIENKTDGGDQKMLIQCDKNHSPYWVNVAKFKAGRRCPHCNRSLGEEYISDELDKYKVKYKREFTFGDLLGSGGGYLRYDFALFRNENLVKLIEYDGKQHFEKAFGDEELFEKTKMHDEIKNKYAQDNNIPLLRIPYTEYEIIPTLIKKTINKYKI